MRDRVVSPVSSERVTHRLDALTGLRIFAAFAIVLHHLRGQLLLSAGALEGIALDQGVGFFYVLSGFILQYSYRHRLGPQANLSTAQFIALRFFRLWPCHIAVILLIFTLNYKWMESYYLTNFSVGQLFSATFLLQAWHPDLKVVFALNGPAWSISVEMFFYAMFPLLCGKALKSPLSPVYIGAAITGAWLTAVWLYMPNGDISTLTRMNPLSRIFEFSVGVSAYEFFTQSTRRFRSGTFLELGALALACFSVAATSGIVSFAAGSMHLSWWLSGSASFLPFAILIGIFSLQEGNVSRLVGWKPVVYFGEISFALYLVHVPVISYLRDLAPWFHRLPLPMQVLVFAFIVLGLSSALHHLVEKPCMDIAKRLLLRPKDRQRLIPATDEGR